MTKSKMKLNNIKAIKSLSSLVISLSISLIVTILY